LRFMSLLNLHRYKIVAVADYDCRSNASDVGIFDLHLFQT
jgi:hypothetical protein